MEWMFPQTVHIVNKMEYTFVEIFDKERQMHFPEWVETPKKQPSELRAHKRLKYMILKASIELTQDGTMKAFAEHCGIERTAMHSHIRAGRFSAAMATAIERAVGRDVLKHEDLMNPLEL